MDKDLSDDHYGQSFSDKQIDEPEEFVHEQYESQGND
jgi:hypothetical protein